MIIPQLISRFIANPVKFRQGFLVEIDKIVLNVYEKASELKSLKQFWKRIKYKKSMYTNQGLLCSYGNQGYVLLSDKHTVWQNSIENPEVDLQKDAHVVFVIDAKEIQ